MKTSDFYFDLPQELIAQRPSGKRGEDRLMLLGKESGIVEHHLMAAALRLQNGDVITAVNDKKVTNVSEFYDALDLSNSKEIWFDVYNDGHTITTGHYKVGN